MGIRRYIEGAALAAGLTAGAAHADTPKAPEAAIHKTIHLQEPPQVEEAPPGTPEQIISSAVENKIATQMKKGENIPEFNETAPSGKKAPDFALPGNVHIDVDVAKIDEAREIALRLAANAKPDDPGGFIGLKVDL